MDLVRILRGGEEPPGVDHDAGAGSGRGSAAATAPPLDLATVRERLARAAARGRPDLLAEPRGAGRHAREFRRFLHREFPRHASEWVGGEVSRRRFLQLAGASLALGGLTACVRQPSEKIVPYVIQPEEVTLGNPLWFASAFTLGGYATGVLVESHQGRPTKVEGNPEHPASLGGTDLFAQASILDLYDPDRLQAVTALGRPRPWSAFTAALAGVLQAQRALGGAGLRILTGTVTSPTLAAQLAALAAELPASRWHVWEPAGRFTADAGAALAFGEPVEVRYDLARADVVVALDSDFLTQGPGAVRYARDFTARRRAAAWRPVRRRRLPREEHPPLRRREHPHLDRHPGRPPAGAAAVRGGRLRPRAGGPAGGFGGGRRRRRCHRRRGRETAAWLDAVAADLRRAGAAGLVVAGDCAPAGGARPGPRHQRGAGELWTGRRGGGDRPGGGLRRRRRQPAGRRRPPPPIRSASWSRR